MKGRTEVGEVNCDREARGAEYAVVPSMLSGPKYAVRPVVKKNVCVTRIVDDELCGVKMKKSVSKDVESERMLQGGTESVVPDGPGCVYAAQMREGVELVSGSDDRCQGEGDHVQGDDKGVDGKVEVCGLKKSRNLDSFGRVRRSGLALRSKIQLFEQAQKGGQTKSEAEHGSRHMKGNRGWI